MKYLIPYFLFLIANFSNTESPEAISEAEIHWCEHEELTWYDFSGQPESQSVFSAISTTYIEESHRCEDGEFYFNVKAVFVKDMSWSVDKKSGSLLKHEQLHFDITELFSRKLRKFFMSLEQPCMLSKENMALNINTLLNDWELTHNIYDHVTKHGTNKMKQAQWELMIKNKLKDLETYKSKEEKQTNVVVNSKDEQK